MDREIVRAGAAACGASISAPHGLRAAVIDLDGERFAVLEWPLRSDGFPSSLTPAECVVAELLSEGLSNAAIAQRRGRSARTIANQLASLYRKLGVACRSEFFARYGRTAGSR